MKKKLRREDSFLGMHMDFHAGISDENIGENTTKEMIQELIDSTNVDYLQIDCKGHPGYTSYSSKLGNSAPGVTKDALKIWREVTEKNGVALYVHYSGVWDTYAMWKNKEWARVNESGEFDVNNSSLFGDYVDKLLIPQMEELCDDYKVDGAWIDGDCWAASQDYCEKSIAEFREKTGIMDIPKKYEDQYFYEFAEFSRNKFREYLRHYVDTIHNHNEKFQICSNWAFTTYMPEPVSANVDFLSGDYPLCNSVRVARLEARAIQNQGMPWDLMAWGFSGRFAQGLYSNKTAIQLMQEAAIVLSLGGGFQVYYMQNRDGSVKKQSVEIMSKVAKFCAARQYYCHKAEPISQIAILYSSYNFYKRNSRLFSGWDNIVLNINGVVNCLCDSQKTTQIIMEHHQLEKYPCVVLPELDFLEPSYIKRLLEYAKNGGKLVIIGRSVAFFEHELGVSLGQPVEGPQYLKYENMVCGVEMTHYKVSSNNTAIGELIPIDDSSVYGTKASTICKYGEGSLCGIYFDLGENYHIGSMALLRNFLNDVIDNVYTNQLLTVEGSHNIDVTLMEKNGNVMINLINTNGKHAEEGVYTFDEITPLHNITVKFFCTDKIKYVKLQPEDKFLQFEQKDNWVIINVDKVEIHHIIELIK